MVWDLILLSLCAAFLGLDIANRSWRWALFWAFMTVCCIVVLSHEPGSCERSDTEPAAPSVAQSASAEGK